MRVIGSVGPREIFECPKGHRATKLPRPPLNSKAFRAQYFTRRYSPW